jgi:hypothetical protein
MSAEDNNDNDGQDPLKQLKSEFYRKSDNLANKLAASEAKIDQIMAAVMAQQSRPEPTRQVEEIDVDPIENPKEYKRQVRAAAEAAANQKIADMEQRLNSQRQNETSLQNQTNEVLNKIAANYPEINDRTSELYIKAYENMSALPVSERSPTAIRAAILEAAQETGTLPVSKRPKAKATDVDDFTMRGSKGGSSRDQRREGGSNITPAMKMFAEAVGQNTEDPEYLKRLEKAASRKSWSKFGR